MIKSVRERTDFNEEEGSVLLTQAEACIRAALTKTPLPDFRGGVADAPVVGVFVSLKRGGRILRACCGSLNESNSAPLGELLFAAAERAALGDVRFPRIGKEELPHLDLEVSVMHNLEELPDDPNLRLTGITIGKHGLIVSYNKARGLLLPQVASENSWDAPTFLEQVCRKANIPSDSWLHPEARLKKFSASIFHKPPPERDVDFRELSSSIRKSAIKFAGEVVKNGFHGDDNIPEELQFPVSPAGWGILVQTSGRRTEACFRKEGTLGELIVETTRNLHQPEQEKANKIGDLLVFSHGIPLHPGDYPRRLASIPPGSAVTARHGKKTAVVIKKGTQNAVLEALKQMGQQPATWQKSGVNLNSHVVVNLSEPDAISKVTPPLPDPIRGIRPPAVAGTFYPDSVPQIEEDPTGFFRAVKESGTKKVRAVMLPHAGWKYCGDIIAETLAQIKIPDTIVIVGPKHTPLGPRWSISNAKSWKIPGAEIPVDEESVAFIAGHVKGLEKEELAHQKEHGIEVLLPFLHHLNPNIRIAPIVLGSGTFDDFVRIGDALKAFRERLTADGDEYLFIISSDMNHFANDKENRRRDKLALDAFITGDTERLFNTCTRNQISMCGLRPAVAVLSSLNLQIDKNFPEIVVTRYETSARISRDPSRVVGYAGALIT